MKAPFVVLVASAVVLFGGIAWAQGPDNCAFSVSANDQSCSDNPTCPQTQDCKRQQFSPPCGGTHVIHAKLYGCQDCYHCTACVSVYSIGLGGQETWVGHCSPDCPEGECETSCSVHLTANQPYALYVCLTVCPAHLEFTCDDCDGCKAYGCVYYPGSSCIFP